MLKSSIRDIRLWNHTGKFILLTNLVALFYGLTSEFGLAYILSAYLIESFLIGIFAVTVLIKKILVTKRIFSGVGAIILFINAYFIWLLFFAVLPMLLMGVFSTEQLEAVEDNYKILSSNGALTFGIFISHVFSLVATFILIIVNFFLTYHWQVLIGLTVIYCFEFLKERPSSQQLRGQSFATLLLRPFWRLLFLIFGPYYVGFTFYVAYSEDSPGPISWINNAIIVLIITSVKLWIELRKHNRSVVKTKHTKLKNLRQKTKLEDTFTF